MARLLFVVAWNKTNLFDYLTRRISRENEIGVFLDRRRRERRRRVQAHKPERRRVVRRRPPGIDSAIRAYGFAVVRQRKGRS